MADSNIGWTDRVWNPVVGCSRVSPVAFRDVLIGIAESAQQARAA